MIQSFPLFESYVYIASRVTAHITGTRFGDMRPNGSDAWYKHLQMLRAHVDSGTHMPLVAPSIAFGSDIIEIDLRSLPKFVKKPDSHANIIPFAGVYFTSRSCDGLLIAAENSPFGFFCATGDCPMLVLCGVSERDGKEWHCFVHCARECLVTGIIKRAVRLLAQHGCNPRYIAGHTLPGIGPCCYGVGEDCVHELIHTRMMGFFGFGHNMAEKDTPRCAQGPRAGMYSLNMPHAITRLVEKEGMSHAGCRTFFCTCCSEEPYFSHVRGDKERNGILVTVQPK